MSSAAELSTGFAWKVHDALDTWTGKVESKASIVLAIESATVGLLVALSGPDSPFSGVKGLLKVATVGGWVALGLSVLFVAGAVFPQLGRGRLRTRTSSVGGLIYFGHLRSRRPDDVAAELMGLTDEQVVAQLANQNVTMSKIAWRKHTLLQVSMLLFAAGVLLFVLAGVL